MIMRADNSSPPLEIAVTVICALLRYILVILAAGVIALSTVPNSRAETAGPTSVSGTAHSAERERVSREYLIKAAILLNLAKFATWPASAFANAGAPIRLCVLGSDPFGSALDSLRGKQIGARYLLVMKAAELADVAPCHVLFVGASEEHRLATILDALSERPILTVADIASFASVGGIVGLAEADDRSVLEVNVGAADRAGVKLSSRLLRLAEAVDTQAAQAITAP